MLENEVEGFLGEKDKTCEGVSDVSEYTINDLTSRGSPNLFSGCSIHPVRRFISFKPTPPLISSQWFAAFALLSSDPLC